MFRNLLFAAGILALAGLLSGPAAGAAAVGTGEAEPFDLSLQRLEKGSEKLSQHRGKPLLLELWATWCLPCRAQSEVVQGLADELEARSVEVIAVNVGEGRRIVAYHLEQTPSPHAVLLDPGQQISTRLGIGSLPALVLLRPDGTVAGVREGLTPREELVAWLDEALHLPGEGPVR